MVIDIVINFKKWDSLSLRMDQTRASHSFDPNRDFSESGFLDLITISMTLLFQISREYSSCTILGRGIISL